MAHTLALRFLFLVLLFFMNSHNIGARDMKTELPEQKQVDSNGATPESTQPNYAASYTNTIIKHNHPSHHEKLNEPYITGYRTGTHDSKTNEPYITEYRTSTQDSKSNEPYITGYRTTVTHETNQPDYITGYRSASHDSKSNEPYITGYRTTSVHEANQPDYITGYRTNTHDSKSNEPYITGYRTNTHDSKSNEPYITGYRTTSTHEANQPDYITGYRSASHDSKSNEPTTSAYEANQPDYITGYRTNTHDSKSNEPYITGYRTNTHDSKSDEPYITGYRTTSAHEASQPDYITEYRSASHDSKSNEPYITGYRTTSAHEANQHYIASYATGTHDSSEPYITKYGRIGAEDPKESIYAQDSPKPENAFADKLFFLNRESGQDLENSEGVPSSNVDHTEAFKTGYFALDDLFVGNTMTLKFPVQEISPFLPRKEADSIPFSMSQLPSVLELFSISQDSSQAKSMRGTLDQCEGETITGETKICATSLESMLEFVDTIIGSETKRNIFTTSHPTTSGIPMQKYTILEVQDINAPKWVACHPLPYPYAIYYCHFIATGSKVFKVSLGGENGAKIEALGICHLDTSDWNPDHIIFKQLGFMPAKNAPVCHFFPVKHLMWVPHPSKATM